jgi:hypothetical protein
VRCHDHKFDAIGLEDYYGMAGMFRSTKTTFKTGLGIWSNVHRAALPELPSDFTKKTQHEVQLASWKQQQAQLSTQVKALEASSEQRKELAAKLKSIESHIAHSEYFHPGKPQALAVEDVAKPSDMRLTIRGNPYALGNTIPRGLVRVAMWEPQPQIPAQQSGRLQLAEWIAHPRHPLTARVAVNRIWQKLFGEGLVRSVDYFGVRGEKPTHPELLDALAARFMREGWSQKKLIRALALSRTYRLSAASNSGDPENRLLGRMNPQRLDAESIRDAMLVASGRLVSPQGGPGLPLEFPDNVSGLPLGPKSNHPQFSIKTERPSQIAERTLYLPVVRTGTQPGSARLRDIFDFPQPAQITGKRSETTVPTQSLYLLNAEFLGQLGSHLAKQLSARELDRLWLRILNRPITSAERDEAEAFIQSGSTADLARALFGTNEFLLRF